MEIDKSKYGKMLRYMNRLGPAGVGAAGFGLGTSAKSLNNVLKSHKKTKEVNKFFRNKGN